LVETLVEKVVLVTGASRGIGRAVARSMTRAGADTGIAARTESPLRALAEEIQAELVLVHLACA